ncbi:endopeptidase La [Patescibacteria group bacterium]|nr:endopeptidase La [Patescibacteria group bacterium]
MQKTSVLPVAPLRDGPVFPYTDVPLVFGRSKSVAALKSAADTNRLIFVTGQKDPAEADPAQTSLYETGTICQIKHIFQSESEVNVLVSGVSRAKIVRLQNMNDFLVAEVEEIPDEEFTNDPEVDALATHVTQEFQNAIRLGRGFDFFVLMRVTSGLGPAELANQMAQVLDFTSVERQTLLEETNVKNRLQKVADQLAKEINVIELERKIISSSQQKFDKNIKENLLKERKRAIEEELGEMDEETNEVKELEVKAKKAGMPEEVLKKTLKEIKRLERMSNMNPEAGYIRTYVEWLLDMPWKSTTINGTDITKAQKVLDEDHYGLEKVKERIVEYLAVMKLKNAQKSASGGPVTDDGVPRATSLDGEEEKEAAPSLPSEGKKRKASTPTILCFVGPPGVGKTSLGKSIARALGRKFVRVSLGGVRDEAEIRGHRRTYVGAMPGRILQGMKQAGSKNPVFMLDEIDKLGNDFHGDPSAALLEALDPEQNYAFSDHYLEVAYDLSEVIFITTANVLETIPPALLDRLEIIHFPGYTSAEKFSIAKKYLIPKQLEANGLVASQVEITDKALETIITRYTKEAGVRNLEREIATVFRKVAKKIAEKDTGKKIEVLPDDLHKYLGPYKFTSTIAERKDEIGLSTGLFWTQAGGGILLIEVATMPGKGTLTLTGQLGDVMQESARAALSFVRSRWKELGLDEKLFQKIDIHVHVPEGAIPKDGPSAGTAITTALASALTKTPVKKFVGMTGEVTLRGRVLEIGGVKEKVIGAHLAGIKTIVLPKDNQKDLEDIPGYILKDLEFKFVESMDEVLNIALTKANGKTKLPAKSSRRSRIYPERQRLYLRARR